MKAHFEMFAAYNAWANRRLYAAAAEMTEEALKAPAGAFFGSLFGTLGHLLVGDRAWMGRFDGEGPAVSKQDFEQAPYDRFADLAAARVEMDTRIIRFIDGETDETLRREISYRTVVIPGAFTRPLAPALAHFFNHQTHHRGQCHHMLTAAGREAPPLDLLYFEQERAGD